MSSIANKPEENNHDHQLTEEEAAVKVQAVFRGFKTRVELKKNHQGGALLSDMAKDITSQKKHEVTV